MEIEKYKVKRRKVETDLSMNEVDRYKSELEAVIANANLKAESHKKEIDGYKRELEAVTAKFMHEHSCLSEELKKSRTEIDVYKAERDKSTAAFKDVITLKNAKIRQLEVELVKVQTESGFYQEKAKSMVEAESTNGIVALQLQLQQFKTEAEFRKNEIDRYQNELKDMAHKSKTESEELNNFLQSERAKIRQLEFELVKFKTESFVYKNELSSKALAEASEINAVQKKIVEIKGMLERKGEDNSDVRSSFSSLTSETVIRARFTDISKLRGEYVYSQSSRYCGIDWSIALRRANGHLQFHFGGHKSGKWSCSVFAEIQLISQKSVEIVHCAELNAVFNDDNRMWGTDFISFKDLVNRENGFVKDDSIIIAVNFRAFPSK
ncbi:hypothetical protein PRIPAC_84458 [Pristionchus pacificus]|nr:hypothetical protein PRIPAC_84458 [Pristionchus pacificus]